MTNLGIYLAEKPVNKAEVSRRTNISTLGLSALTLTQSAKLRADELYLIALAINVDPCEVSREVCGHLKLAAI